LAHTVAYAALRHAGALPHCGLTRCRPLPYVGPSTRARITPMLREPTPSASVSPSWWWEASAGSIYAISSAA